MEPDEKPNVLRLLPQCERQVTKRARPMIAEKPISLTTAYFCECGKKWDFLKEEAATERILTRRCSCGRTIILWKSAIYGKAGEDLSVFGSGREKCRNRCRNFVGFRSAGLDRGHC
jgi:hypothetical protein